MHVVSLFIQKPQYRFLNPTRGLNILTCHSNSEIMHKNMVKVQINMIKSLKELYCYIWDKSNITAGHHHLSTVWANSAQVLHQWFLW